MRKMRNRIIHWVIADFLILDTPYEIKPPKLVD